jgi:chemotaxis methyl-accepting protein methylase
MSDSQCVAFLKWALPRLGMRWAGYRKVRRQVCNRARRRASELGLSDLNAYRRYLEAHPGEWAVLDSLTPITISRFYRDHGTFDYSPGRCSQRSPPRRAKAAATRSRYGAPAARRERSHTP